MAKLNLPITGICSFAKYPIHEDLETLAADFAVPGVPWDVGVGFLSGARLGPRRIREVSTHYGRGAAGLRCGTRQDLSQGPLPRGGCGRRGYCDRRHPGQLRCDRSSGPSDHQARRQDDVELVLQMQLLLLERLDLLMGAADDVGLHVLDLLVQLVVAVEQVHEVMVGGLELGDQVAVFGEHRSDSWCVR